MSCSSSHKGSGSRVQKRRAAKQTRAVTKKTLLVVERALGIKSGDRPHEQNSHTLLHIEEDVSGGNREFRSIGAGYRAADQSGKSFFKIVLNPVEEVVNDGLLTADTEHERIHFQAWENASGERSGGGTNEALATVEDLDDSSTLPNSRWKGRGTEPSKGSEDAYNRGSKDGLFDGGRGRVPDGLSSRARGDDDENEEQRGDDKDGLSGGGNGDDGSGEGGRGGGSDGEDDAADNGNVAATAEVRSVEIRRVPCTHRSRPLGQFIRLTALSRGTHADETHNSSLSWPIARGHPSLRQTIQDCPGCYWEDKLYYLGLRWDIDALEANVNDWASDAVVTAIQDLSLRNAPLVRVKMEQEEEAIARLDLDSM